MPKKAIRASSNVFSMFEQNQILEFKEAFSMLDQDADGTISLSDLKEVYNQLGMINSKFTNLYVIINI